MQASKSINDYTEAIKKPLDGVNCNRNVYLDVVMCETTTAPSMISKCKLNLHEKIGNLINIFFMQCRKPHHFYFNLISNFDAINCYLRIQM